MPCWGREILSRVPLCLPPCLPQLLLVLMSGSLGTVVAAAESGTDLVGPPTEMFMAMRCPSFPQTCEALGNAASEAGK